MLRKVLQTRIIKFDAMREMKSLIKPYTLGRGRVLTRLIHILGLGRVLTRFIRILVVEEFSQGFLKVLNMKLLQ